MTRFTLWTAAILLTFAIRPALGASDKPGEEPHDPIEAELLTLGECPEPTKESLGCLSWTAVSGEQASFVVRFDRLDNGQERLIWEGSVDTKYPWFDIVSDGPEWLADELTIASDGIVVEVTLFDHWGMSSAPMFLLIRVIAEDSGSTSHEADQGVAAWGDVDEIDVEWTTYDEYGLDISGHPPHDSDEGLAAWGEINAIDVEWNSYGDPGLEMADEPTHETDQGVAAWSDEGTIEVEWTQYE